MKLTKTALYKLVIIVAVLAAVLEFFFAHPHYHEWWNTTPGFNLLFGFAGCWLLIFVAKIVMTPLLPITVLLSCCCSWLVSVRFYPSPSR